MKTYGEDFNQHVEGRRYYVPDYSYTDPTTGALYHRVRFTLEGDRGGKKRKASVFAEVRHGTYDFRYILVVLKDQSRLWTILDKRPELQSEGERQKTVANLLLEDGWSYYVDGDSEVNAQARHLGEYFYRVPVVRCDVRGDDCDQAGVINRPAWAKKRVDGRTLWETITFQSLAEKQVVKGTMELADLERMTLDLRRRKFEAEVGDAGFFGSLFSSSPAVAAAAGAGAAVASPSPAAEATSKTG